MNMNMIMNKLHTGARQLQMKHNSSRSTRTIQDGTMIKVKVSLVITVMIGATAPLTVMMYTVTMTNSSQVIEGCSLG